MKITYKTVNLEKKEVELEDAVDVRINDIQIRVTDRGLILSSPFGQVFVKPIASNVVEIIDGKFITDLTEQKK